MSLIAISRELHGNMKLRPLTSFAFAADLPAVRVLAAELVQAQANLPLAFIKEDGNFILCALLGLGERENLFVADDGRWLGRYIPAMLRRYPFVLGRGGAEQKDLVLLVEDSMLSEHEGEALFDLENQDIQGPLKRGLELLISIETEAAKTAELIASLAGYGVLEPLPLQVNIGNAAPAEIGGIYSISEAKLNALPDEALVKLHRSGAIALAYGQIYSLGQLTVLQALATAKLNKPAMPTA
jgi:hypothetical protein